MPFESSHKPDEIALIYCMLDAGRTAREISEILAQSGIPMSERGIYRYREKWAAIVEKEFWNESVDWADTGRLRSAAIPLVHLPQLRSIQAWAINHFPPWMFDPSSSYRSARWQSHILSSARTVLEPEDVWVIGELFALREIYSFYHHKPVVKNDLEALLTFSPWEDASRGEEYLRARNLSQSYTGWFVGIDVANAYAGVNNTVPALQNELCDLAVYTSTFLKPSVAILLSNIVPEDRHLLPTQQRKHGTENPLKRWFLDLNSLKWSHGLKYLLDSWKDTKKIDNGRVQPL